MNNPSSSVAARPALSFASGEGARDAVTWITFWLGSFAPKVRPKRWQANEIPVMEPVIESRYHVDDFGRPRILSRLEVTLYALARPVVLGAMLGYGAAIGVVEIHHLLVDHKATTHRVQIARQEAIP